jgi:hypothetical protein
LTYKEITKTMTILYSNPAVPETEPFDYSNPAVPETEPFVVDTYPF